MQRSLATAAAIAAGLILAAPAGAATKHGIKPLSPKAGVMIPVGQPVEFRARIKGPGTVFYKVCANKKKDKYGVICGDESMARGKKGKGNARKGRIYTHRPTLYTFPDYFLQKPGTYYWQAYRIDCRALDPDCSQEGPIMKFKVG